MNKTKPDPRDVEDYQALYRLLRRASKQAGVRFSVICCECATNHGSLNNISGQQGGLKIMHIKREEDKALIYGLGFTCLLHSPTEQIFQEPVEEK